MRVNEIIFDVTESLEGGYEARALGHSIPAVSPEEELEGGAVLWFAGVLESVASLRKIPGALLCCFWHWWLMDMHPGKVHDQ